MELHVGNREVAEPVAADPGIVGQVRAELDVVVDVQFRFPFQGQLRAEPRKGPLHPYGARVLVCTEVSKLCRTP